MTAEVTAPKFQAGTWELDPAHTEVSFSIRHLVSKVRGSFGEIAATLQGADDLLDAKVSGTVKTASVETGNDQRDGHLKSGDFFDVETFPEMTFVSTGVAQDGDDYVVTGDLTIKDVTKSVDFAVEFGGVTVSAYGQTVAGFEATAKIIREEFGLNWNAALEAGGVLAGSEVKIVVTAEFILQNA